MLSQTDVVPQSDDLDVNSFREQPAVVLGSAGSGKTTTALQILAQSRQRQLPFLVLSPVGKEYRKIIASEEELGTAIRIYTPGNELVAPFRLNPFEFELGATPAQSLLQRHIELLKAVFHLAYPHAFSHPVLLDTLLCELYQDKGWDFVTGNNARLPDWSQHASYPIFPTMSDFLRKLQQTIMLQYSVPSLQTYPLHILSEHVTALSSGAKGMLLDTPRGTPASDFCEHATILEIDPLVSHEEKTLLMGLLFIKLYEYRRLHPLSASDQLQHLLVLEEAQTLFAAATKEDLPHSIKTSVVQLAALIPELRKAGQSLLFVAQNPASLCEDVLQHSGIKLLHRSDAQQDVTTLSRHTLLTDEELSKLQSLPIGEAIIVQSGSDQHIHRHSMPMRDTHRWDDQVLAAHSVSYIALQYALTPFDIGQYGIRLSPFGTPEAGYLYQVSTTLVHNKKGRQLWATLLARAVHQPAGLTDLFSQLIQQIQTEVSTATQVQRDQLLKMMLIRGCAEKLQERGKQQGWSYVQIEELRLSLTKGILALLQTDDLTFASGDLDRFARKYLERTQRKHGPLIGCKNCRAICHYRTEVEELLQPYNQEAIEGKLQTKSDLPFKERLRFARNYAWGLGKYWLGGESPVIEDMAYCSLLHILKRSKITEYEQIQYADRLKP